MKFYCRSTEPLLNRALNLEILAMPKNSYVNAIDNLNQIFSSYG